VIFLLAPTSGPARIRKVARTASGFVYFVSVLGVTGARTELPTELPDLVKGVRQVTDLPVGVGFGISTPEQAAWVAGFADAVIVGSAFARIVEESERSEAPARVAEFTGALRGAMRAARERKPS
jgi:tryptophan synthase alpha chain